jgi:type I restriction enzyme S subunit
MRTYKLKELLSIKNGKDHKELNDGNIPIFGSGGIMRFGDRAIYNDESILLPRKGTLSNIQYVKKPFWTVDTIYYSIINKALASPFYLFNYIKSLDLSKLNSGTGVPSMTFDSYYNLDILLPELETQQKIAAVLSALDSKIELNNRINAELEALAKTLYDYWFVQFDFPDKNGKPYKTSGGKMVWNEELKREIPEGWEVKTLDNYAEVKKGDLITAKDAEQGSIKVIAAGVDFSYLHSTPNRLKNTITISGSGANAGFINFWREPIFASDCITVRGKSDIETITILQYLNFIQPHILNQATGSAQPHVYPSDIKVLNYSVPPKQLSGNYGKVVLPMNEKIGNNILENQKLTELRDWLLPMLMNGQVKVN